MAAITVSNHLEEALRGLRSSTHGLVGSALASGDGLVMASDLPQVVDEQRVGAMAATILALGERTTSEFDHGQVRRILIEGDGGFMVVMSVSDKAALSAVAVNGAKLGMVFYQMDRAAEAIKKMMG